MARVRRRSEGGPHARDRRLELPARPPAPGDRRDRRDARDQPVELHPYFQQRELRGVHEELGIVTEAWSPLAQGAILEDEAITDIAEAHGKTPGQVVIRWHLQLGNVVIPKSVTPKRIEENFDVFDFELSSDEMSAIESLDRDQRIGPDPDEFELP